LVTGVQTCALPICLSINEICELAKQAAHSGCPLDQANVFEGEAREAFASAYHEYASGL
jgi:hypothetical protein